MTDHPERIWATVNGGYHRSGRSGGAWYLTGGWDEILTREGQQEYLRRDGETMRVVIEALEIIAGERQCLDNLMGNRDVACAALAKIRGGANDRPQRPAHRGR